MEIFSVEISRDHNKQRSGVRLIVSCPATPGHQTSDFRPETRQIFIFTWSLSESYNYLIKTNKILTFLSFSPNHRNNCVKLRGLKAHCRKNSNFPLDISYLSVGWLWTGRCQTAEEVTCEIECHPGANGYPGVKLYHGFWWGRTFLIASSNWSIFIQSSSPECPPVNVQTKQQVSVLRNERQFRQQLTRSQMKFCQLTLTFRKHIGFKRKN